MEKFGLSKVYSAVARTSTTAPGNGATLSGGETRTLRARGGRRRRTRRCRRDGCGRSAHAREERPTASRRRPGRRRGAGGGAVPARALVAREPSRARPLARRPARPDGLARLAARPGRRARVLRPGLHRHLPDRLAGVRRGESAARGGSTQGRVRRRERQPVPPLRRGCRGLLPEARPRRDRELAFPHRPHRDAPEVWKAYGVAVQPNPSGDVVHSSLVYFIDAKGHERYLAMPDRNKKGIDAWAHGIAAVVRALAPAA